MSQVLNGKQSRMLHVLGYHRVAEPNEASMLDPRLISATPQVFEHQMRYLAKNYQVVSMEEVLDATEKRVPLPERAVLITFDDAYIDFAAHAWPVLKQLRLPVTVFVPTAYPDQPMRAFWWDRLYRSFLTTSKSGLVSTPIGDLSLGTIDERRQNLRRLQNYVKTLHHAEAMAFVDEICCELDIERMVYKSILSWDELRQLAKEGVTLGAHTQTHPILTQLPHGQIRQEVMGSQQDLKRETGYELPVFCYPNGDCNDTVVNIMREEGFVLGFTMQDGHNHLNSADLLRLCRMSITRRTSPLIFRLRLLPLFNYVDRWRHRRQRHRRQLRGYLH